MHLHLSSILLVPSMNFVTTGSHQQKKAYEEPGITDWGHGIRFSFQNKSSF